MRILFLGLGSIGKRHARILREISDHELYALRTKKGQEENDVGVKELYDWEEVDKIKFDVAFITNPTYLHINTAMECVKRKMHLFVEKPIDVSTDGFLELLRMVEDFKLSSYVAYPLRFHPVVIKLKEMLEKEDVLCSRFLCTSYLPHWRSQQNSRESYSQYQNKSGGILFELSHEIDLISYLFGPISSIQGLSEKRSDVTVDANDICDLIIRHAKGWSSVFMNLFSRLTQRYIEIETKKMYIKADLHDFSITYDDGAVEKYFSFDEDHDSMYVNQLKYFLKHVGQLSLMNDLKDAKEMFVKMVEFQS